MYRGVNCVRNSMISLVVPWKSGTYCSMYNRGEIKKVINVRGVDGHSICQGYVSVDENTDILYILEDKNECVGIRNSMQTAN